MNQTKSSPAERCHLVLRRLLAAGPKPASGMRSILESAGYAWRTVQDAAVRLNVQRTKSGMGGGWTWTLPAASIEDTSAPRAFGDGARLEPAAVAPTCLAAYDYEVPTDGMMHGVPNRG